MVSWSAKIAIPAAAGAVALLAAGCGGGSSAAQHGSSGASGQSGLSPVQAIALAATQAKQTTSFATDLSIKMTGSTAVSMSGSMALRSKPSLLATADFSSISAAGQSVPGGMSEIITDKSVYLKMAALTQELGGKQWVELPYSELQQSTGINVGQLLNQVQGNNPLVQTQMLAAAKNVRDAGTQTVDGVATTHYTGTYPIAAGLAKLPASLRSMAQQQIQKLGLQSAQFNVWIDGQHQTRRLIMVEHGTGETVTVTLNVTGINQPVNVSLPPASQVATIPASALSGK
jgi:hypothetical protein